MKNQTTKIIALRVPDTIYCILIARSKEWDMSVSAILRELIEKIFDEKTQDINPIKTYKKRTKKGVGKNGNSQI